MRKIIAIIVIILVCLFLIMLRESFGGEILVDFSAVENSNAKDFAREFKAQIQKRKSAINGHYSIKIFEGAWRSRKTEEVKLVIGIFINNEEDPVDVIWRAELFSLEAVKMEVARSVNRVLKYLNELDKKIKIKLRIMEVDRLISTATNLLGAFLFKI